MRYVTYRPAVSLGRVIFGSSFSMKLAAPLPLSAYALCEQPAALDRAAARIPAADPATAARYQGALLVIPLDGTARVGADTITAGECGVAGSLADVTVAGRCLIAQPCAQAGSVDSIQPPPSTSSPR